MACFSDQKLSKVPETNVSGVPKIHLDFKLLDFKSFKRLKQTGPVRPALRVLADGYDASVGITDESESSKESPGVADVDSGEKATVDTIQGTFSKSELVSADSVDARKRKADRELPSSREWTHAERMENRPNPGLRVHNGGEDHSSDLKNRKTIESCKELNLVYEKENIHPGKDYNRQGIKNQTSSKLQEAERGSAASGAEKRRLQVLDKPQNLRKPLGSRRGAPLSLLKQIAGGSKATRTKTPDKAHQATSALTGSSDVLSDFQPKGFLQHDRFFEDSKTASNKAEPMSTSRSLPVGAASSVQDCKNDVDFIDDLKTPSNSGESMSISQSLQLGAASSYLDTAGSKETHFSRGSEYNFPDAAMQVNLRPSVAATSVLASSVEMAEVPVSTGMVEASQIKVISTSVRQLSTFMSSLAIHCEEGLHVPSVCQKTGLREADSDAAANNHENHGASSMDAQQSVQGPGLYEARCVLSLSGPMGDSDQKQASSMDAKQSALNVQGPGLDEARCVLSLSGPMGDSDQKQGFTSASVASPGSSLGTSERHIGVVGHTKSTHLSGCSVLPATSVPPASSTACSFTLRTASAPVTSSLSTSQHFMGDNIQTLRKQSPSPADEILKSSNVNHISVASSKVQVPLLTGAERLSPVKAPVSEGGTLKTGCDKGSQGEVPMIEGGGAKPAAYSQVSNLLERKVQCGGDQQKKRWETEHYVWVNGKRYQKLGKIGSGGSSEVYKVIAPDCTIYALKRIKLKGRDYSSACGFYQEIEYLNKLRGKSYIIQLIDYEVTDKNFFRDEVNRGQIVRADVHIYMVLEYGEIDLAHMLADKWKERSQGNKQLDENWLRLYWQQILEAVSTIHEERIVHSDLKPANFLLVKGVLKLIDFGIAKAIQSDTTNIERESQVGTLNYMSPEAFMMNEKDERGQVVKCGRPSDIWSLGCILYQMVYGTTPFSHITRIWAKVQEITNPNHKINFPPLPNPYLLDIMKKCLAWKRDERSRIPELLNHPFLQPHSAIPVKTPYSKQLMEDVLLQIQTDYESNSDIRVLSVMLLEKLRLSGTSMDRAHSKQQKEDVIL